MISIVWIFLSLIWATVCLSERSHKRFHRSEHFEEEKISQGNELNFAISAISPYQRREKVSSLPCEYLEDPLLKHPFDPDELVFPFVWDNCPQKPLQIHLGGSDLVFDKAWTRIPLTFEYPSIINAFSSPDSSRRRGSRKTKAPEELSERVIMLKVFQTLPSSSQYYPFGTSHVQFEGRVVRNDCFKGTQFNQLRIDAPHIEASLKSVLMEVGSKPLKCDFDIMVHDPVPPTFKFCPQDRIIHLKPGEANTVFTYDHPIAYDNFDPQPRVTQTKGKPSQAILGPGKYAFEFQARDEEGNTALCRFTVKVVSSDPTRAVGELLIRRKCSPEMVDFKVIKRGQKSVYLKKPSYEGAVEDDDAASER